MIRNNTMTRISWLFVLTAVVLLLPDSAHAAMAQLGTAVCAIVAGLRSGVAKGIATLAIIFLGIAAFFGKANWGLAIIIIIGILAIFGSVQIVGSLGMGSVGC